MADPVFVPFRFRVLLYSADRARGETTSQSVEAILSDNRELLCGGYFSEVAGLEVTMEPKAIAEGGRNWGEIQRSGPSRFSTVVLKRGVTTVNDLWSWFDVTTRGANYGYRLQGKIEVLGNPTVTTTATGAVQKSKPNPVMVWQLANVLPVKFKGPDLSASANQVAIEELHLVHEGLQLQRPA